MQQVATGGTWALHRRSSSTFTSNGNTVLLIRREDTLAASPAPFRAFAVLSLCKKTNSQATAIFPLGMGQLVSRQGGPC